MTAIGKSLIVIGLNICGLVLLVLQLVKNGHKYPEALRLTWETVIFQRETYLASKPNQALLWMALLGKTWWLMLLIFGVTWVNSQDLAFLPVIIFLGLFHMYWFLEGHVSKGDQFDRILNLNHNWGIVYKKIGAGSGVNLKTLAELDLRKKNLLVLAIDRQGELTTFPKGLEVLNTGDRMVMFGDLYSFHSIFDNDIQVKTNLLEPNDQKNR